MKSQENFKKHEILNDFILEDERLGLDSKWKLQIQAVTISGNKIVKKNT